MLGTRNPTIFIHVYDYADVPKGTWTRAMRGASEIFRRAGVATKWGRCKASGTGCVQGEPAADFGEAPGLTLRILPRFTAYHSKFTEGATGFALVAAEAGNAAYAAVFYDRVALMVQQIGHSGEREEMLGEVLARVMAHELGHLLLGSNSHSRSGIMRARWNWQDLRPLDAGRSHFTSAQAEIIRSQALAQGEARASGEIAHR